MSATCKAIVRRTSSPSFRQRGYGVRRQRRALDVTAVPERVEEEVPGGAGGALVAGGGKEALNCVWLADLPHCGRARDERADLVGASRDPACHRHGETALAGERLGRGKTFREPAAQQPLAEPAPDLE